jgi:hypothetical protein
MATEPKTGEKQSLQLSAMKSLLFLLRIEDLISVSESPPAKLTQNLRNNA